MNRELESRVTNIENDVSVLKSDVSIVKSDNSLIKGFMNNNFYTLFNVPFYSGGLSLLGIILIILNQEMKKQMEEDKKVMKKQREEDKEEMKKQREEDKDEMKKQMEEMKKQMREDKIEMRIMIFVTFAIACGAVIVPYYTPKV